MSLGKKQKNIWKRKASDHVIELEASTATVTEAAEALHVEPGMIAKTMSFCRTISSPDLNRGYSQSR